MSGLSERERAIRQRLKGDFPHYAEKCLKIRPKKGEIVAFSLNRVQQEIHERLVGVYEASMEARPVNDKNGEEKGFTSRVTSLGSQVAIARARACVVG